MKARSYCARALVFVTISTIIAVSVFAQDSDLTRDLHSSFTKFDVVNLATSLRSEGESRRIAVRASGKDYELIVTPHDIRGRGYRAEDTNSIGTTPLASSAVNTYKGTIAGEEKSEVRLTIDGTSVEGFFESAAGRLFIEPASRYSRLAHPGDSVVYRAEDSLKNDAFFCESDIPGKIEFGRAMAEAGRTESVMAIRILELATEADVEWVNTHGGAAQANAEILSILNMVEGTFNAQLNLSIHVVYQHTWTAADPYGAGDMNGVLTNFQNHWNANYGSVSRDAAHLFTGKSVAQSRGLAYLGVICRNPGVSYGLSGYVGWAPGKFLIPAHELGHNLGADHAEAAQGCANSLMNASLTGSTPLSFCAFSQNSITTYISTYGACMSESTTPSSGPAAFDFDGDGRSDLSVYRPSSGVWYLNRSTAGFSAFQFGLNGDQPAAADYDGDDKADPTIFRNGVWYRLMSTSNTADVVSFGLAGDLPTPADFDGDGRADVGVFRPSSGVWYSLRSSNGAFTSVRFGLAGDIPVTGDYDADGRDDINLFRPATGTWYRINSSTGANVSLNFGLLGDKPVSGDFDGDSRADIAVWRPVNGVWYVMRSATGAFSATPFGLTGDIPSPADFDGDGKADIAVFRPSNGVWYRLNSSNGAFSAAAFGMNGDKPIPSYYVQ